MRAAVRLDVALVLQRLHALELLLDDGEPPPEEARAVCEGGHLDGDRRVRLGLAWVRDADGKLARACGVADEVLHVGRVGPLDGIPSWSYASERYRGRRGGERGEDESADVRERLGGVQEEDGRWWSFLGLLSMPLCMGQR